MLTALAIALGLLVWGAHGAVPWNAAALSPRARAGWCLAALPAGLAALTVLLRALATHPDAALAAGLGPGLPSSVPGRCALALLGLALAGDAVLLLRRPRDADALRNLAALGLAGTAGSALLGELLRLGDTTPPGPAFAVAVASRLALGLGAGEALLPRRPALALLAAPALAAWILVQPAAVTEMLVRSGDLLTLGAAALLFAVARWLPARLRRPALVAAAGLAALGLWRAQELGALLAAQTPATLASE